MLRVGVDIGSTTVKATVLDNENRIVWKEYIRHETRQVEKTIELLERLKKDLSINKFKLYVTGSGGSGIAKALGCKHIQEVNALVLAVEHLFPEAGSVFELGGQDAKFVLWQREGGKLKRFTSMNDKCAGGTGATIDRIILKFRIDPSKYKNTKYVPEKVHEVAGKCGVFAETDIISLYKQGVPEDELLISLFDAIVLQNLSTITRGYTPRPKVLLLGGPNYFFKPLREAWKYHIGKLWEERNIKGNPEDDIFTPDIGLFLPSIGSALHSVIENTAEVSSLDPLYRLIEEREKLKESMGERGLWKDEEELKKFLQEYSLKDKNISIHIQADAKIFIGVDGGSTSTKGVALDEKVNIIAKEYILSKGDPIEDTKFILKSIKKQLDVKVPSFEIGGVGFTGYAKDLLKEAFGGDIAIVETVAHTRGALHYFPDAEVICDVGGQDIKVIILRNGSVKDFKLNTQCSAGNGYYLQSTAERFGYKVEEYADVAFKAKYSPRFNFGCAVFLEADIVNFQQLGWSAEEIMAGLAKTLPLNVWLYVMQEPNLKRLGRVFVLQGGTHKNLAVVKAQVDFIKERVPDAKIYIHPEGSYAGAIGVAIELIRSEEEVEKDELCRI